MGEPRQGLLPAAVVPVSVMMSGIPVCLTGSVAEIAPMIPAAVPSVIVAVQAGFAAVFYGADRAAGLGDRTVPAVGKCRRGGGQTYGGADGADDQPFGQTHTITSLYRYCSTGAAESPWGNFCG